MHVSHDEKNNVEQSSTVQIVNLQGVLKPYLRLDLIDPRSSIYLEAVSDVRIDPA